MVFLKWALILGGIIAALWGIDRLMLFFEARGWIYWRKKKPSPGATGNALLELHSIFEPSKTQIVEQQRKQHVEEDENGEPIIPSKGMKSEKYEK